MLLWYKRVYITDPTPQPSGSGGGDPGLHVAALWTGIITARCPPGRGYSIRYKKVLCLWTAQCTVYTASVLQESSLVMEVGHAPCGDGRRRYLNGIAGYRSLEKL